MGKKLAVLSVAVVLLMTWAGAALAADCGEPFSVPKYQVGDKWTWRNEKGTETVNEVVGVNEGVTEIKWSNGDVASYDKDWVIQKVVRKNGEVLTKQGTGYTTIGQKVLDFPLLVGKKWEHSFTAAPRAGGGWGLTTYYEYYAVLTCEEVTTPAGTFPAFKIEVVQRSPQASSSGARHFWYSPQVKTSVRNKYVPSGWWAVGRFFDSELIKFDVK